MVDESKLLTENPWSRFPWIEGQKRPIRQFDSSELLSFLSYLSAAWPDVTVAAALAKVCLWSGARRQETTSLNWQSLRIFGDEHHFATIGKWGIARWFRVPEGLYRELLALKLDSSFVFAAYPKQLRAAHANSSRPWTAQQVDLEFMPDRFGDWFFERMVAWSNGLPKGHATTHIFRKTALQFARQGEDLNQRVADDARVSASVMMSSYVEERDEELRQASNRTFARLLASLSPEVARAYGHVTAVPSDLEKRLDSAIEAKNWSLVAAISAELGRRQRPRTGKRKPPSAVLRGSFL